MAYLANGGIHERDRSTSNRQEQQKQRKVVRGGHCCAAASRGRFRRWLPLCKPQEVSSTMGGRRPAQAVKTGATSQMKMFRFMTAYPVVTQLLRQRV